MLEARFGLDAPRRNQLARLTEIALTFALIIAALPFLMLQWGFSGADIRDWFKSLFFGIEVGQFRISLARILLGIVLFIALLFATRLFQRWLREKALQQTRMDPGIANSIDTVVGYVGIALAALLAVSYAGLDITNLAIVAGALSVGIGFGLQSIVNNFVSGLILLIERPIKVGDRIVVGDQQGLVRRISVRATEIETFDRASLIVPNSELITGRVLNWTHRDSLGAVNVKVGVGYDSDPEQVIAILKKCADEHPEVLRAPAPVAFFENFGDSALMFNLRISLPDIAKAARRAVGPAHRHPEGAARGRHRDPLQPGRRQPARPRRPSGATSPSTCRSAPARPPRARPQPNAAAAGNGKRVARDRARGMSGNQLARSAVSCGRGLRHKARNASCLVFPEHLLAPLVALLGFERERGDGAGIEALQADRLAGLLAKAVGALLDARERGIDLGDQLALAVAGPAAPARGRSRRWRDRRGRHAGRSPRAGCAASRGSGARSLPSRPPACCGSRSCDARS